MAKDESKQTKQLITNDMLDWIFGKDIRYSEKRKPTANDGKEQRENMIEMFFDGVSLRDTFAWIFSNRWIAEQPSLRVLGDQYLVDNYNLEFKLIDSGKKSVFVNTSPEAIAQALIAKGVDMNVFTAELLKAAAAKKALMKQQAEDEAALMEGVDIPNE